MCHVCITENGSIVGIDGGHIRITLPDDKIEMVPKELVQGIAIYGKSQLTARCIQYCLENEINVSFFSQYGKYYGTITPTNKTKIARQKKQIVLSENKDFCHALSKQFINAKINNQYVVAKRYVRASGKGAENQMFHLRHCRRKVIDTTNKYQLMGYEGIAARNYFEILSLTINEAFIFNGRSKRPPRDPFNAMISFGYAMLTKEINGIIENAGLNAYAGFLHEDRNGHPTLASDLIEEWRPIIVDSTVMSMIQHRQVSINSFIKKDNGYLQIGNELIKKLLLRLEAKMNTEMNYLDYISKPVSFRMALWHQTDKLVKAIERENPLLYHPVYLR